MHPKPGDVILYPANGKSALSSRLVVAGEIIAGLGGGLEQYSHAAVLSQTPGKQYEATFPFTGHYPIDTSRTYEVWRLGDPSDAQRRRILDWCRSKRGKLYNLLGVLTCGKLQLPDTYYCSQFACLAYAAAGIVAGDAIMSPDSIPQFKGAEMILRVEPEAR